MFGHFLIKVVSVYSTEGGSSLVSVQRKKLKLFPGEHCYLTLLLEKAINLLNCLRPGSCLQQMIFRPVPRPL